MDARLIITELLHDPKAFKPGQTIRMLYLEKVGLCDDNPLTKNAKINALWANEPYAIDGYSRDQARSKRFNWVAITHSDNGRSKVLDLRDAVCVMPIHPTQPLPW